MRFSITPLEERIVLDAALMDLAVKGPVEQINLIDNSGISGGDVTNSAIVGNDLYVLISDSNSNNTLWKTDGQSIEQVTLDPSLDNEGLTNFVAFKNHLYFIAVDTLWKVDGTTTSAVANQVTNEKLLALDNYLYFDTDTFLNRTDGSSVESLGSSTFSAPDNLTEWNDSVYFFAYDNDTFERTLWKMDNPDSLTPSITAIKGFISTEFLTVVGDQLMFVADDGNVGFELWKSNGTSLGTQLVEDITLGPGRTNFWQPFIVVGDKAFIPIVDQFGPFIGGFLVSDGTEAGTHVLNDTNGDPVKSYNFPLTATVGDQLFLAIKNASGKDDVWVSNGSDAGTHILSDLSNLSFISDLVNYKDTKAILLAYDDSNSNLWVSDGTDIGTSSPLRLTPSSNIEVIGDYVYFSGYAPDWGVISLFKMNATDDVIQIHDDLNYFPFGEILNLNESLISFQNNSFGSEMDVYVGYASIHVPVAADGQAAHIQNAFGNNLINPDQDSVQFNVIQGPQYGTISNNNGDFTYTPNPLSEGKQDLIIVQYDDGEHLSNLAQIFFDIDLLMNESPTIVGTLSDLNFIKDINSEITTLEVIGNTLYFQDSNDNLGITEGTSTTTYLIPLPGVNPSISDTFVFKNHLYLTIDFALWAVYGTPQNPELVQISPEGSFMDSSVIIKDDTLYFASNNIIYSSDGTVHGTTTFSHLIFNNGPGEFRDILNMADVSGTFFLFVETNDSYELWTFDPLSDSLNRVTEFSKVESPPVLIDTIGDKLFFSMKDSTHGRELWVSNGTELGTHLVKDIRPGTGDSLSFFQVEYTVHNDKLIFRAADSSGPSGKVWISDGTEIGTVLMEDQNGDPISAPSILYFYSFEGKDYIATFESLWRINESDTSVELIFSDGIWSNNLVSVGDDLYFATVDINTYQYELMKVDGNNLVEFVENIGSAGEAFAQTVEFANLNGSLWANLFKFSTDTSSIWIASPEFSYNVSGSTNIKAALGNAVSDPEGQSLQYIVVQGPAHGTVNTLNGAFTYTPTNGYNGSDSLVFQVQDPSGNLSNTAQISFDVTAPPNNAPVANNDFISFNEDIATLISPLANDTDNDGPSPLSVIILTNPLHGSLTPKGNGTFRYTATNANFNGVDSFTYQANDGAVNSNTATVFITVNSVNDAPDAINDTYTIKTKTTTLKIAKPGVLKNDHDVEGQKLTAHLLTKPTKGSVTFHADGSFTYKPNSKFKTTDKFSYLASDGQLTDTATVTIKLKGKAASTSSVMALPIRSVTPVDNVAVPAPSSKGLFDRLYEKWFG